MSEKIFNFATTYIFEGETARQFIAGIFYVCTIICGFSTPRVEC